MTSPKPLRPYNPKHQTKEEQLRPLHKVIGPGHRYRPKHSADRAVRWSEDGGFQGLGFGGTLNSKPPNL